MSPETKYKLSALVFFFVLCTGFFLQFVHPYYLSFEPADWSGHPTAPVLRNNRLILPIIFIAVVLLVYLFVLYRKVKHTIRFLPLVGFCLLLITLAYVHYANLVQHLDYKTWSKIMQHLGAFD